MGARERYRFGSFTLDADERRLVKGDEPLTVSPKAFDVLLTLVRHAGCLVTKRDLLQAVWADSFVEEGILAVHVSALRRLLDDPLQGFRCIETVSRSGYRFRSDVTRIAETAGTAAGAGDAAPVHPAESRLVVLPFANLSADADSDYFSDGLTEEIIHALARVPGLKVIARTSAFAFKNRTEDVRRIGSALGVTHIVEGSVRKSGERIRVSVQLIRADDGTHLWSERYERRLSDVFSMQDEIASAMRAALQLKLAPHAMTDATRNIAAYEAFLKGVHHLNKMTPDSMLRAREQLEEAIDRDPQFVAAHSTLATYFMILAANNHRAAREVMPLARGAAEQALRLDSSVAEAHSVIGQVAALFDFDWRQAEQEHALAMARPPVSPAVRIGYVRHLLLTGRPDEGAKHATRMLEEDPLNLLGRLFLAHCLQAAGHDAAAAAQIRQVLELEEHFWLAYLLCGINHLAQGMYDDAFAAAERAYVLAPWNLRVIGLRAGTLRRAGETAKAEELVARLNPSTAYGVPMARMLFHQACSEVEQGAEWAQEAIEQRDMVAIIHLLGPDRRFWSSSARWPTLARMMNLPAGALASIASN
jgi:TolB-like protein/Tfp pilus assembly protein PilF